MKTYWLTGTDSTGYVRPKCALTYPEKIHSLDRKFSQHGGMIDPCLICNMPKEVTLYYTLYTLA